MSLLLLRIDRSATDEIIPPEAEPSIPVRRACNRPEYPDGDELIEPYERNVRDAHDDLIRNLGEYQG